MKDIDLIQALKRIKVQTGGLMCLGCGHEHNCGVHGCAVIREEVQKMEELLKYKTAIDRMGKFGQLFEEYEGCPRGAMGRMCDATIQEEALAMDMLTDVDMGRWRPVNEDVLQDLLGEGVIETGKGQNGEPLTIDQMRELVQADREGRCVVLPCKVGDKVFQQNGVGIFESQVKKIIYDCGHFAFDEEAIGERVFLTRESAEAALKGEQA